MNNPWVDLPPTEPGFYEIRCRENDYEPLPTTVFCQGGVLFIRNEYWSDLPLDTYHFNLTHVRWRHAIHR